MSDLPDGILFGLLPRETTCGINGLFPTAAGRIRVLLRSDWRDIDLTPPDAHVYRQAGGTCAAHGSLGAALIAHRLSGAPYVIRNPYPVYALAKGARPGGNPRVNWNSGSTLEANLQALVDYGAPPVADDWPLGTNVRWPDDWEPRMATGKVLEWLDCGDTSEAIFDTAASILCDPTQSWPVVIGTAAFGGAHCVVATTLRHSGSTWYLGGLNSWGPSGTSGSATIPGRWEYSERQLRDMAGYGAWSPVSTVETEPTP